MDPFVNQDVTMIVNHPVVREETIGVEVEVVDSDPTHVEVEEDLDLIHVEEVEEGLGLTHVVEDQIVMEVEVEDLDQTLVVVVEEGMVIHVVVEDLDPTHVEAEEDLDQIHVEEEEEGLGLTHVVAVEEAGMNAAEVVQEDMTVMLPAEGLMVTLVDGGVVAPLEVLEVMAWGQDLEEEEEEGNALV